MNWEVLNLYVIALMLSLWAAWAAYDTDRKFRAMDERMWNVENAQ